MIKNKADLNPTKSVNKPYKGGIMAPPTIAVHNNPEPFGFKSPIPSIAKVKMVGNIIELNNPTHKILHIENNPVVLIDNKISAMANVAKMPKTLLGFIILVRYEPAKRPIIAPLQ